MDRFTEKFAAEYDGRSCDDNIMIYGDLRITVITPELVRIERGGFCDLPTQTVLFRNLGRVEFSCREESDKVRLNTDSCEFVIMKSGDLQTVRLADGRGSLTVKRGKKVRKALQGLIFLSNFRKGTCSMVWYVV